ncbi:hypothetical protein PhCBS80983_g03973 [Powellomyces hirtus]|uniref:GAG-pre-integrase domain-containing protein n=1 Tax=Powellomyces hirtus TaxID=109895 RepID=A0A507E1T7_9FUNG|nr:hypothetical protein PhCBS80983_g03973 [Powellomyces hirtus]
MSDLDRHLSKHSAPLHLWLHSLCFHSQEEPAQAWSKRHQIHLCLSTKGYQIHLCLTTKGYRLWMRLLPSDKLNGGSEQGEDFVDAQEHQPSPVGAIPSAPSKLQASKVPEWSSTRIRQTPKEYLRTGTGLLAGATGLLAEAIAPGEEPASLKAVGHGTLHTWVINTEGKTVPLQIQNCWHVPKMTKNLLSLARLAKAGACFEVGPQAARIIAKDGTAFLAKENQFVYTFETTHGQANAGIAHNVGRDTTSQDLSLWHQRLGHLNVADIGSLPRAFKPVGA